MGYIVVTGGCGYIGSHMTRHLLSKGYNVLVIDNLERGFKDVITTLKKAYPKANLVFEKVDLRDKLNLLKVFSKYEIDSVLHFAGYALVGESMTYPTKYFENNTGGTINLVSVMLERKINKIIFSSTCNIYGNSPKIPITENNVENPSSLYGLSKQLSERVIESAAVEGLNSIRFRYFNAAGDSFDGLIGERHDPETHLIPRVLDFALGKSDTFKLFGDNYPTPDGTCIRDYVHVEDLAEAHLLGLKKLEENSKSNKGSTALYNLGTENGTSNKEIIEAVKKISGKDFKYETVEARPGDPAILIADSTKAFKELGWKAKMDLNKVIESAYNWHSKR
ncbi:MAG: UDP-glucose 4-epimerase GalE [bacterium]